MGKGWIFALCWACDVADIPVEDSATPDAPVEVIHVEGDPAPFVWVDQAGAVISASPGPVKWSAQGDLWQVDRETGEWVGLPIVEVVFEGDGCTGRAWIDPVPPMAVHEVDPQLLASEYPIDWAGSRVIRDPNTDSLEVCPRSRSAGLGCSNEALPCARRVDASALLPVAYRPDPFPGPLYLAPGI